MNSSSPTVWLRTTFDDLARDPAGGCGDDGAEVRLLDQCLDVDALDDFIEVYSLEQAIQVDPVQHVVQIDLVQQRVHVQRGNHKLYHTIGGGLRPLLRARDQPALRQKPLLR